MWGHTGQPQPWIRPPPTCGLASPHASSIRSGPRAFLPCAGALRERRLRHRGTPPRRGRSRRRPRQRPGASSPFPRSRAITGKLDLRVVYPPDGATIVARDSTFIFGSLGTGDAQLTVNGIDVPVLPNGAWLGWLPLPPRDNPRWSLVAARGTDTVRVTRRLVLPPGRPALSESGALAVDSATLRPGTREARLGTDLVRVALRAPRTAAVDWVAADGSRRPLRPPRQPRRRFVDVGHRRRGPAPRRPRGASWSRAVPTPSL
jgi:hypothetical protein